MFNYCGLVYLIGLRRFTNSGGAHWHRRRYQVTRSLVDAAPYGVPHVLHLGASSFLARFNRPSLLEFHGIKCIRSNIGKTPWDHKRDHNEKKPFVLLFRRVLPRLANAENRRLILLWGGVLGCELSSDSGKGLQLFAVQTGKQLKNRLDAFAVGARRI